MIQCSSEMEAARYRFDKFEVDHRFLQRVPAISTCREASPPSTASAGDMDIRLRSGSMSSAYHAEYEESDSDTDHDCNAIDMSVIKNDTGPSARDQRQERMNVDLPIRGRQRALGELVVERGHGPPPPQLIMRDPHAPRDDLNRMTSESPLSSSGSSSSPSLLITSTHNGLGGHGLNHAAIDGHGRPNGLAVPPLPPPPFLSQLAQPGANHIMQQMQQQHHGVNGVAGSGILLAANDSKGRHSSFSSVNSSDGAVSPPPHTLPNPTHHSGNSLNQHQLPFVPQHIPHDLVHKMSSGQKKKLPTPIPKECKDEAYWERRKRNNESAKRSRELRRIKEQQTTLRVLYLEQENLQLRTELGMLRSEVDKLRQLLYVTNKQQGRGGAQGAHALQQPMTAGAVSESLGDDNQLNHHHASLITQQQQGNAPPNVASPAPPSPPGHQLLSGPQTTHHQPLPPISTLRGAMGIQQGQPPRQIILASPPSRPQAFSGHAPMPQPMSPHMSRSPSPQRCSPCSLSPPPQARQTLPFDQQRPLSRRRELSISPQIAAASPASSRDAIDLSPLSPPSHHRVELSPSPSGYQARPLALVQPATDGQACNGGSSRGHSSNRNSSPTCHSQQSSYQGHGAGGLMDSCTASPDPNVNGNGNCQPQHQQQPQNQQQPQHQQQPQNQQQQLQSQPAEQQHPQLAQHQQHPLQPAILRHKKARPSSPFRVSPSPSPPQQQQQQQQIQTNLSPNTASNVVNGGSSALNGYDANNLNNNGSNLESDNNNHLHHGHQLSKPQHQQLDQQQQQQLDEQHQQQHEQQMQSQRQHSVVVQS